MFHPWGKTLRPKIAVYGIQLPGREHRLRETPVGSLDEMLHAITAALSSPDNRPFVLFGHSMGAILAFEVARQLRRAGRVGPSALLVSGRGAPDVPSRAPRLGHLPAPGLLCRVAELYGGIPEAILGDAEMAGLMGKALQADLSMIERYECSPDEPVPCPITAFGGDADAWVARSELEAWRQHTRGEFSAEQFRGDHFYFRAPEILRSLLARVRECCLAGTCSGSS